MQLGDSYPYAWWPASPSSSAHTCWRAARSLGGANAGHRARFDHRKRFSSSS